MFKILLVDDEYHVINHIQSLLEQNHSYDFDIIKTNSGVEAINFIHNNKIDIALLDINMPKITGLQLASSLIDIWPSCRIIFLTAYEIFDYIYEANHLPNSSYLLKTEPDSRILEEILSKCYSIEQETENLCNITTAQKHENLIKLLQDQALLKEFLFNTSIIKFRNLQTSSSIEFSLSMDTPCYLALMNYRYSTDALTYYLYYLEYMKSLAGNIFDFTFVEVEKGVVLWLFQEKMNPSSQESPHYFTCLKSIVDDLLNLLQQKTHQHQNVLIYPEQVTWDIIPQVFQHLYNCFYSSGEVIPQNLSTARISSYIPMRASKSDLKNVTEYSSHMNLIASMRQTLYQGLRDPFMASLHICKTYCTSARSMHDSKCIKIYFSIVVIILDYIDNYKLEEKISMKHAIYPLYFIQDFPDWESAFHFLKSIVSVIFTIVAQNKDNKNHQIVNTIKQYIAKNLGNNLTLSDIANTVNYNDSHISRLFKQTTGIGISEYITSERIHLAKNLLSSSNDSIQRIAQLTGFNTSQYFSNVFKKQTGLSPIEYRSLNTLISPYEHF